MIKRTQDKFALEVKTCLWRRGSSITALARSIKRPRSTVSQAINHGRFPRVRQEIQKALGQ